MPELVFPFITGLTLILAGILVGYFLWFRERDQSKSNAALSLENRRLMDELEQLKNSNLAHRESVAMSAEKIQSLEQLCDDLMQARNTVEQQNLVLDNEIDTARKQLRSANEQLVDERNRRVQLSEELLATQKQHLQSSSDVERETRQFQSELARQTEINVDLEKRLEQISREYSQLKSEWQAQSESAHVSKIISSDLEKEQIRLQTNLTSQLQLLEAARSEAATANSAKQMLESAYQESQQRCNEQSKRLTRLETEVREYSEFKNRAEHLELALELLQERTDSLLSQRDDFANQKGRFESEAKALQIRVENQQTTIEQLRSQTQATDDRRRNHHQNLLKQIESLESTINRQQQEKSQLLVQVDEQQAWRQKNNDAIKRISEENANLIAKVAEFEKIDRESLMASEEYKARIASVVAQRDAALREVQSLQSDMERMQNHAKSNEETIRSLRRERGAILMRNREYAANSFPRIHSASVEFSKADQISAEYGGTVKLDPVRGPVFVEPPRKRDDLKKMFGIAEVLEEKLNEFGIFTFKQIMDWDERAIKEFSELLAFKDRITRDDWMGQAAKLYDQRQRTNAA